MSNADLARRTQAEISFDGVNITKSISPYLLSLTYTDNEADETDDLQIKLQDRAGLWLESWIEKAIDASASERSIKKANKKTQICGLLIHANIAQLNWNGDGTDRLLDCGTFELDSVDYAGAPNIVTIKATSLRYTTQIRQTKRNKAWESYFLSGIAKEMASLNGMSCMFLADEDPHYTRIEQFNRSDINFLSELCKSAGISLKATNNMLVLFDQKTYERKPSVLTIAKGDGSYLKFKLHSGKANEEYDSCRVRYTTPTGKLIQGIAKVEDYNENTTTNQQLEIRKKVSSSSEAKKLASKILRLHNKYSKTASFVFPGNPALVAGVTVELKGWGAWNGKYIAKQAKHTISNSGYTTAVELRKVLNY